jgi:hypothetical protein
MSNNVFKKECERSGEKEKEGEEEDWYSPRNIKNKRRKAHLLILHLAA